jgi:hypothetical protein
VCTLLPHSALDVGSIDLHILATIFNARTRRFVPTSWGVVPPAVVNATVPPALVNTSGFDLNNSASDVYIYVIAPTGGLDAYVTDTPL